MTNREAYEKAAGYSLDLLFFIINGINPNGIYRPRKNKKRKKNVGR